MLSCPIWICDANNFVTLIGIAVCIIAMVLMSVHAFRYFKYRKHIVLKKRFANITIFVYFCQMLKELSWIILLVNNLLWYDKWNKHKYIDNELVWQIIRIPITYFLYFCCVSGWITRFWMSTYHIHLIKSLLRNKWQSIINANMEKNWYIKHKNTLGNIRFIAFIVVILLIIIVGSLSYLEYKEKSETYFIIESIIEIVSSAFASIVLYGIYRSIRVLDDNFFIYDELKRLLYILTLLIIPLWVLGILLEWNGDSVSMKINDGSSNYKYIISTIYEMCSELAQVTAVLISTWWINGKILPIIQKSKYRRRQYQSITYLTNVSTQYSVNKETTDTASSNINNNTKHHKRIKAKTSQSAGPNNFSELILKTRYSDNSINRYDDDDDDEEEELHSSLCVGSMDNMIFFEQFVLYLSNDYCINTLLGFIEMIQFQQYINEYMIHHPEYIESHHRLKVPLYKNCKFPDKIPKSLIIFGDKKENNDDDEDDDDEDDDDDLSQDSLNIDVDVSLNVFLENGKWCALKLYQKYIMSGGAPYKIDITDSTRSDLDNWIQSERQWMRNKLVDIEDLLDMFNESINECFAILSDSFKRFIKTDKYQKLKSATFNI